MLTHAHAEAARAHVQLVRRSLEARVVDLHGLVSLRLGARDGAPKGGASMASHLWALGLLPPAAFSANSVTFVPKAQADTMRSDADAYVWPCTLAEALYRIDAFVALASARAAADLLRTAPTLPPHASVRERATFVAATSARAWPTIRVHEAFCPRAAQERGQKRADTLAASLPSFAAPRQQRSLFVALGARDLTDLLSPYVRDVGHALVTRGQQALARQVDAAPAEGDDPYALANAICAQDLACRQERARAEASVGIEAVEELCGEAINCARLDLLFTDPDVPPPVAEKLRDTNALVVRLAWDRLTPGMEAAAFFHSLMQQRALAGIALQWPWPMGASWPKAAPPYVFARWVHGSAMDTTAWPFACASGGAPTMSLPLDADTYQLTEMLASSGPAAPAALLGATAPGAQQARPSGRALAASALRLWAAQSAEVAQA